MKELALLVAAWLMTALFIAGAIVWLLVAAYRSSFRYSEDELTPEARRAMTEKLASLARKRAREVS